MTPILGETQEGIKTTRKSLSVLPEVVIYDVELTLSLPPAVSAASGLNAIAHAIEALYARDTNPIVGLMAVEGISALSLIIEEPSGNRRTIRRPLGRLAVRPVPGLRRHGAAPQALPHVGRHVLVAACRDARDTAATFDGLQRTGGCLRHGPRCAGGRKRRRRTGGSKCLPSSCTS